MTGLFDRDEALGSGPEMPVMPNAAILAAGEHDQAHDREADRAPRLGASGRGKMKAHAMKRDYIHLTSSAIQKHRWMQ